MLNASAICAGMTHLKSHIRPEPSASRTSAVASEEEEEEEEEVGDFPAVTDPVLTQPGLGTTTTTITTITQTGGDWSTGLFNVCADKTTCKKQTQHRTRRVTS